jgi:hypothetical protein
MFILKQWTVLHMSDWVEESVAVSESKDALIRRCHTDCLGKVHDPDPHTHIVDYTIPGMDLERYCKERGTQSCCLDHYFSIDTIEVLE